MGLSRVPLIGALMSFMKPHPHDLISSKRSSSQNCHIGVQFQQTGESEIRLQEVEERVRSDEVETVHVDATVSKFSSKR